MASKKQHAHAGDVKTNGSVKTGGNKKYIDTIDPDDPEYIRELQRPAEIKEDVRQMVDRHRVKQILQSRTFREELDDIISDQMKSGPNATHLQALQQISDLLLPQGRALGALNVGPVIPISDIRGVDSLNYSKTEKVLRCKLATLYRLFDLHGWANGFQCSVSARVSADNDHFLVAPFGMLFREITAASLVRVDMSGKVLDPGVTTLGINQLDFQLHTAIYAARPDILCVVHLRHPITVAVSVLSCGLLPLCPEAMELGEVSVADYAGYVDDKGEANTIARALGPRNKAMVLKNCGVLVCGQSVEEAYYNADNTVTACDAQLRTLPIGLENISLPSDEVRRKVFEASNTPTGRRARGKGTMEFEALMRQLDHAGYRTGYAFVEGVQEARKQRAASDMAISSSADAEIRASSPHKPLSLRKHLLDWSQSPTIYHKEGEDETAAKSPRWVSEGPGKTTPKIKEHNANAYAPLGPNANELKEKFKQIRQEYYGDKKSAGPQSRLLEGVTWDEAGAMKEGGADVRVHAASKGIIQRDHQKQAVVLNPYTTPNPFESVTDADIDKYKHDIENKSNNNNNRSRSEEPRVTAAPPVVQVQSPPSPVTSKPGPVSPTKSTSSAEATTTHDERSSREGSPAKEPGLSSEGRKSDKKKKKLFSFGKKDKKEKPQ